jgi:hypothetical protein
MREAAYLLSRLSSLLDWVTYNMQTGNSKGQNKDPMIHSKR